MAPNQDSVARQLPPRRKARAVVGLLFLLCFGVFATGADAAALDSQPISAVVLVDESGSLSPEAVAAERAAAAALVSSDLSKESRFMIAGFGSANARGQKAVEPYCDFITTEDRAAREKLVTCAGKIHAREPAEGNDTDHAKALQFALERLREEGGPAPVVFLLTDGVLDVSNSPGYGRFPGSRNAEALRRIREQLLPAARRSGTQIWPLGFGGEVSRPGLEQFAAGGGGSNSRCSTGAGTAPHAVIVRNPVDVVHRLVGALGGARCAVVEPPSTTTIDRGASRDLVVRIPPIATDGALTVVKADPSFRIEFFTPEGDEVPSSGTVDGQIFERASNGRVESLRITNPIPGEWKVKVSDPRRRASRSRVVAFAIWEGQLQASIFASPVAPIPGRDLAVEVRVLSRDGAIGGRALDGLRAEVLATGSFGRVPVQLARERNAFRGAFPLPAEAKGDVEIIARVGGRGVAADRRVETLPIQTTNFVTATFDFDVPAEVHAGDTIEGTVTTDNQGPPVAAGLQLGELSESALLRLDGRLDRIPSGRERFPFTLTVSEDAELGEVFGELLVVSQGGEIERLAGAPVEMRITEEPTFLDEWWWAVMLGVLVALAAVGFAAIRWQGARRDARARRTTKHLVATLLRGSDESGVLEQEEDEPEFVLYLDVRNPDRPRLRDPETGDGERLVLTRDGAVYGLTREGAATVQHALGEPSDLGDGLTLLVTERHGMTAQEARAIADAGYAEGVGSIYGGESGFGGSGSSNTTRTWR